MLSDDYVSMLNALCTSVPMEKMVPQNEAIVLEEACNSTHIDGIVLSVIKDNVSS